MNKDKVTERDFRGYANQSPDPAWPDKARIAVSLVLNIEEGAELSLGAGDERNEAMHEFTAEVKGNRDLCMESHFEYGSRSGYWRVVELLQRYGVTCTVNACVRALETTPWITEDIIQRGYEIMCHGYRWEAQAHLSEADERALIQQCTSQIEALSGNRPFGWHTKSYPSVNTRQLLAEEGYLYDSNVYNDDLPYALDINERPYICVPYSFDTNDMRFFNGGGFEFGDDFARYCGDAFDWLWQEGEKNPKMMTIALHSLVIGRPGRIAGLEKLLKHIQSKGQVWWPQRVDIARHWQDVVLARSE
jgi:allantoinase